MRKDTTYLSVRSAYVLLAAILSALAGCRGSSGRPASENAKPEPAAVQPASAESPAQRFSRLAKAGGTRQELLAALNEKADLASRDETDSKHLRSRWAYTFSSFFDADNKEVAAKLKALGGPVTHKESNDVAGSNDAVMRFSIAMMSSFGPNSLQNLLTNFSKLTPEMELVNLRMLLDEKLVGDLGYSPMQIGKNSSQYLLIFINKPSLSLTEVREAYGPPSAEGAIGEGTTTYGLIRFYGSDCIVFPTEKGAIPKSLGLAH